MEVKIQYNGKEETVKLRKLKWGENNDCVRKATTMIKGESNMDMVTLHELRLLKSIEESPFPKTLEALRDLDQDVGDAIFSAVQKINVIDEELKKNLETPSLEKN